MPHRTADTTSEIAHAHAGPQPELVADVAFLALHRLVKRLAATARREMERATPTELVEIGDEIVKLPVQRAILVCDRLALGAIVGLLVCVDGRLDFVAAEARARRG